MGRDATKACGNPCFECRKAAALKDERLSSRLSAAEALGLSESTLADYELGKTKVIPSDKIVLMADLYKAPELMAWYCSSECPIGKLLPMTGERISTIERTTLRLLRLLRSATVDDVVDALVEITADGTVSEDEKCSLAEVLEYLDQLIKAAGELRVIGIKALNGG